jgi:hypothetical protein
MRNTNDDAFDENGLLKDGKSVRVTMMMRDGMTPSPVTVVDAFGNDGLALHQPGYRYLSAAPMTADHAVLATRDAMRDEARADYIRRTCDAWKGGAP